MFMVNVIKCSPKNLMVHFCLWVPDSCLLPSLIWSNLLQSMSYIIPQQGKCLTRCEMLSLQAGIHYHKLYSVPSKDQECTSKLYKHMPHRQTARALALLQRRQVFQLSAPAGIAASVRRVPPTLKTKSNSFFAVEQLPRHSFSHKAIVVNFHRWHMKIKCWGELLPSYMPVKWPNGHYMSDKGAQFPKCEEFIIALCQGPDRLWQPAVPPTNNRPRIHKTGNTKMNKATKLQGMCQLVINLLSHPCSHRFLTVLLVIKWFVAFGNRTVCCLHKVDRWRLTLIKVYGCRCPSPSDKTDHFRSTVEALMPLCWHYCGSPLWNVSRRHANYKNVNSPLWPVPNGGIIPFIF